MGRETFLNLKGKKPKRDGGAEQRAAMVMTRKMMSGGCDIILIQKLSTCRGQGKWSRSKAAFTNTCLFKSLNRDAGGQHRAGNNVGQTNYTSLSNAHHVTSTSMKMASLFLNLLWQNNIRNRQDTINKTPTSNYVSNFIKHWRMSNEESCSDHKHICFDIPINRTTHSNGRNRLAVL